MSSDPTKSTFPEETLDRVDAFILYNEREEGVEGIVHELDARGVSTHFWRRDVELDDPINELEERRLRNAAVILVLLGNAGWGPNHLRLAEEALGLGKRLIPVLIGEPPADAFTELGARFRERRYMDLRQVSPEKFDQLVAAIRKREQSTPSRLMGRIINVLIDGNEEQRSDMLRQARSASPVDRSALAVRLREEISTRFSPGGEKEYVEAIRDPSIIASVRSWMISTLIWIDVETPESKTLLLRHVYAAYEPERKVRFWVLAGLYAAKATYLPDAATTARQDEAAEVEALARAILEPSAQFIDEFRSRLASPDFKTAWPVLRVLRIVPIPDLIPLLCKQLSLRSDDGTHFAYDAVYALSNLGNATVAAPILDKNPGAEATVQIVIRQALKSNDNATRNFSVLLARLNKEGVDRALVSAGTNQETEDTARMLRRYLAQLRGRETDRQVWMAGYASDTIDVRDDRLDISQDVRTLTAVMLATEIKPPLAIGLFGGWGSGKSFFMEAMQASVVKLARQVPTHRHQIYCSNVVQIKFNAWHYVDTNLWASLVSHILEELVAYVTDPTTPEEQKTSLLLELGSARIAVEKAEAERQSTLSSIEASEKILKTLQEQRLAKEVQLTDLRPSDIKMLLGQNPQLKQTLEDTLAKLGVPAVMNTFSELTKAVAQANTTWGRITAFALQISSGRTKWLMWGSIILAVLVIPLTIAYVQKNLRFDNLIVTVSGIIAQVTTLIGGALTIVKNATRTANTHLETLEQARQQVSQTLAGQPTAEEQQAQVDIDALKEQEKDVAAKLTASTERVAELEARIRDLNKRLSLAGFLAERSGSEDYQKHLGLISTIRRDFETLEKRLQDIADREESKHRRVDRIVLYIDDLDRCPENKVMEVLQAVHLMLAHRLFVVVVAVDPRWLLHSLGNTYSAFKNQDNRAGGDPDPWRTTPQDYLEKIFQIPFNLRRMTESGYGRLMEGLLTPSTVTPNGDETPMSGPASGETEQAPPDPDLKQSASNAAPQEEAASSSHSSSPGLQTSNPSAPPSPDPARDEDTIPEEALAIQSWEAEFAGRLFSLIPTPRAAKRLSNIYRILKARVQATDLGAFEGTEQAYGNFQVPMLLLAVVIGAPTEAADLFPRLQQHALKGKDPGAALQDFGVLSLGSPELKRLEAKLVPIVSESGFPGDPALYLEWLPPVSRFSFEAGQVLYSSGSDPVHP